MSSPYELPAGAPIHPARALEGRPPSEREPSAFVRYVSRVREFDRTDWLVYAGWVGMMLGLVAASGGFLLLGSAHGVRFPEAAWLVPGGAFVFALAIAVDTIGHRTIYKEVLKGGEAFVHQITIFCGVASCVLLCAAQQERVLAGVPAAVFTVMSFVYSLVDEGFHWHRYATKRSDSVEMWSHLFIFIGHGTMMLGWWRWFWLGYPGVPETLRVLEGLF
jgi:hypothetical protein